jgi:hypothetical protein
MRVRNLKRLLMLLGKELQKVEGVLEQIDKRLNHIESELRELRRELSTRFYWLIGISMTMWVTIIVTILLKPH